MSCEICVLSSIQNVQQIRKLLFPNCKTKAEKSGDWQEIDWSWKDETEADKSDGSWLQQCLCSISPIGDVFVIAYEDTVVFLTLKWEDISERGFNEKFIVSGSESLPASEEFDGITSIFCLPLASSRRSSYGRPDWTAVVIGTRLGHVKMFTEKGHLLVSQKFHEEPVTGFKCRTFDPHISAALAEQQEEVIVLYKTAVVTIDGFSLYQTLRACRSQVAKATARGSESITPPPIAYKKWGFQDQGMIRDCESIGVAYINIFDNLMNVSIQHGFCYHTSMLTSAASVFLTTGQSPYASFCYAVEGSSPILMKDVATAVASKLKSVITNFFGAGNSKTPADKATLKIEPATPLPNRFELRDASRMGERVFTSPNRRLSAITDDFGRVILIDNLEGIAVRIWKGYRDAQCAWIEVYEDESETVEGRDNNTPLRIANFLIIYGPRRGILEVWTIQQGPRIAAFNIGKHARLIYCNHGILGLTNVKSAEDGKLQSKSVYFLDSDGVIKTVTIPFHYALSAKFSKRVRDLHLFNKLKVYLRNINENLEQAFSDIFEIVIDIKTSTILLQALNLIMSDQYCSVAMLKFVFTHLKDHLLSTDSRSMDLESKLLYFDCLRKLQLLHFYENIEKIGNETVITPNDDEKPLRILSEIFNIHETEVDIILNRIGKYYKNCHAKKCVKFETNEKMQVGMFLSCFQTYCTLLPNASGASLADITESLKISLSSTITDTQLIKLAFSVFNAFLKGNIEVEVIKDLLITSGIELETFMNLLITCWLQIDVNLDNHICLKNLYLLLNFLASSTGTLNKTHDSNNTVSLWKTFENIFAKSNNIPAAYMGALTCRGLVIAMHTTENSTEELKEGVDSEEGVITKNLRASKYSNVQLFDWETIHLEVEHWNLLVKQLEDAISVITLMFFKLPASFVSSSYYNFIDIHQTISVSSILEGGNGAMSELIAKWMSCLQYDSLVYLGLLASGDNSDNYYYFHQEKSLEVINSDHQSCATELKICFDEVKTRLPLSLNSDVVIISCCWEFAALWNKDKDDIQNLINSMKCFGCVLSFEYGKGLGVVLWHTFFRTTFCSVAVLLEKVGKTPKDRICRKEIGMSDISLKHFIGCSLYLLNSLWRNYSSRSSSKLSSFICEDCWQIDNSKSSLIDIIVSQKDPNYDLAFNHFKLAMIMHLMLTLGVKSVKPLSLNVSESGLLILKDLNTTIINYEIHPSIKEKQVLVLCKAITSAVAALSLPNYSSVAEADHLQYSTTEHIRSRQWISKILEFANVMELECDRLQRHYVLELYSSGFDMLAEESLRAVDDRELLGSQLLLLAGQRVYYIIQTSGNQYVKLLSLFPPFVTTWFETLNQNSLRCMLVPLSLTATIIGYIINVIPENRTEHKIAVSLLDPLQIMRSAVEKKS